MTTQKITKINKTLEELLPNMSVDFSDEMYVANTHDIEVSVNPEFVDSQVSAVGNLFVWIYHVQIRNNSAKDVKLINRHWKIIDEQGGIQEVDGEGVVGETPTIAPGSNFQYSSGVHLKHSSGIMTGNYQMQHPNGEVFEVKIPTFSLDIPTFRGSVN